MATAGDVITLVQQMRSMDIAEIGDDSQAQQNYLVSVINRALKELAHIAYRVKVSDVLNITVDGYQTFMASSQPISDLYSPLRILDASGNETNRRTAFSAPKGWWKESDNAPIHTKGLSGNHTLHYVAYPASVSGTSSPLDFPEAGTMGLVYWCSGIILESRNAYEEANAQYARAQQRLAIPVLANEAARGYSSGGYVPSFDHVKKLRGDV